MKFLKSWYLFWSLYEQDKMEILKILEIHM